MTAKDRAHLLVVQAWHRRVQSFEAHARAAVEAERKWWTKRVLLAMKRFQDETDEGGWQDGMDTLDSALRAKNKGIES